MCTAVTCRTCGKPTVSGCGQHVEQALRGVPRSERCQGHDRRAGEHPVAPQRSGLLSRLFGGE